MICLVGPYNREFDAGGPNPYQVLGLGALYDSRDMTQARQLEVAVAEAELYLAAAVVPFFVAGRERPTHRAPTQPSHHGRSSDRIRSRVLRPRQS
jgi:hypothetical protein